MNRTRLPTLVAAGVLAAAAPATSQAQEPVDARHPLAPDASVSVWNAGGSVRVVGWPLDSLHVAGEVRGGGRFFIGRQEDDAVKLGLEAPAGSGEADFVVRVPATATVWVRTASADIEVRGLTGAIDVHSVAGTIDVEGEMEHLSAESMGGDLRLAVAAGTARAKAGAGGIEFVGAAADLTLATVDGDLRVEAPALRRGGFTSVDGDIRFRGGVRKAGSLAVEAHGGDVELLLRRESGATFELSTIEGRIDTDLTDRAAGAGAAGSRTLTFETGKGESRITVQTYSGSITVREAEPVATSGGPR